MRKIGEILVQEGLVRPMHVERALWWQRDDGGRIGSLLIRLGYVEEREFLRLMAAQLRTRPILIQEAELDPRLIAMIPPETARQANAIPIALQGVNLVVATSDPHNVRALREIEAATGHSVEAWLAGDPAVANALDRYYPRGGAAPAWIGSGADSLPALDAGRQRSIEALIDGWIAEAAAGGAQVLVIQMTPGGLQVRGEASEGGCELARPHASVFPEVMTRLRARSSLRVTSGPARREAGVLPFDYHGDRLRLGIMLVPDVYGFSARVSLVEVHNRRLGGGLSAGIPERDQLAS